MQDLFSLRLEHLLLPLLVLLGGLVLSSVVFFLELYTSKKKQQSLPQDPASSEDRITEIH